MSDLASLTVYVFNTRTLVERVRENAAESTGFHLYSEVIPRMVREGARVYGHVFDGYWAYARTLDAYYAANMDALGDGRARPRRLAGAHQPAQRHPRRPVAGAVAAGIAAACRRSSALARRSRARSSTACSLPA